MAMYSYHHTKPQIGSNCFIAPSADVVGDIRIGSNTSIWHGCVLRGDVAHIEIGENTNIQDMTTIHVDRNIPTLIGADVTVGHKVMLHGCTVKHNCLIGMGAIILDGAYIGENSVVGAGSLITPGKKFPPRSLIMGSPAKLVRELTPEEVEKYSNHYRRYTELAEIYLTPGVVKKID